MEMSYQAIKSASQSREADELRTEARRKNLLILIMHYLMQEGYVDTANTLEQEAKISMRRFDVCDNIDLETILMEYESYYFVKFQKYPKITKKASDDDSKVYSKPRSGGKLRRTASNISQGLPKITTHNIVQRPVSRTNPRTADRPPKGENSRQENGSHSPAEVENALNVSAINRNGGEGALHKKERLLKPVSAFTGANSEMRELAAVISRDIYLQNPNVRWDDIIGLDAAKRLVKEAVVYPIRYPQLFTGILSPWKGLLLYGPPGTGKTLLAKAVATECNTTFFNISASTIVSKWRGDSEKLVRVLFELARYHAPSTIFLDELESVMSQRGTGPGGEHEGSRRMKTELLVQMDGLARSDDLVFVLAASNLPWELDYAMLRRLEKRILVDLPSKEAREAMIRHWLPPVSNTGGVELRTELQYSTLGEETDGYSGSDIKLVCKEAAMRPVRKIFDALENHQPGNKDMPVIRLDTVTTSDFLEVLAHTKPSARSLAQKYSDWQKEFESV
ncbi:katanin p60 ATPase-containing subunit A-like 2 isoform X2 [Rana temporaria]|uniref:katanin p60 ATPase-containing subunit A-like 2 isoform X2 n=1 Tax=Rana temporaria TaxID=8407 RepID=UPI001AAD0475|nr:katanin p60 ATPase-containing subunit A-like 2 isoform X2 [Rana temporaria]